jgi:hypothetical protein
MGVVHKLKSEVIDFILEKKKDQPRISVRRLAEITSETFQTRISKSSISNVLKDSSLNSPVGRPPVSKKDKIFTIPSSAKERIRKEINKVGLSSEETVSEDNQKEDSALSKPDSSINIKEELATTSKKTEDVDVISSQEDTEHEQDSEDTKEIERGSGLTLRMDPLVVDNSSSIQEQSDKTSIDGVVDSKEKSTLLLTHVAEDQPLAGIFVLYAVLESLTRTPFFTPLLTEDAELSSIKDVALMIQAEIIYQWSEKNLGAVDEVIDRSPIWRMFGFSSSPERDHFRRAVRTINTADAFRLRYFIERELLDVEVGGYRIVLRNGGAFFIDAMKSVVTLHAGTMTIGRPLNLAIMDLSEQMIAALHPLVIHHLSLGDSSLVAARNFCLAFCSMDEKPMMNSVAVLNPINEEIASFEVVPNLSRTFLMGFPQANPELKFETNFLEGSIESTDSVNIDGTQYTISVRNFEFQWLLSGDSSKLSEKNQDGSKVLKIIEVNDNAGARSWFLTNSSLSGIHGLLGTYSSRWSRLTWQQKDVSADGGGSTNGNKGEFIQDEIADDASIMDYFIDFGEYSMRRAMEWLCPKDWISEEKRNVMRLFCLLPGRVINSNQQGGVCLNTRNLEREERDKIQIIARRFNQFQFSDGCGRQLFVKTMDSMSKENLLT